MTPNIETAEDDEISLLDLLQVVADNLRLLIPGNVAGWNVCCHATGRGHCFCGELV